METQHAAQRDIARSVITRLSSVVIPRCRQAGMQLAYVPGVFREEWVTSLPLPRPQGVQRSGSKVTLIDGSHFHREADESALAQQYRARPRTRVMESINSRSDGWHALATLHLARVVRRHIVCSLYESHARDSTLGPHDDEWDGVIVQMRGAKSWRLWPEPSTEPRELVTRAGDVLLLPRGTTHDVATPNFSVHLTLAMTNRSLNAPA